MERGNARSQSKKEEEAPGRRWVRKGGGVPAASKGRRAGSWPGPQSWPRGIRMLPSLQGNRGLGIPLQASSSLFLVIHSKDIPKWGFPKPWDGFVHGPAVIELAVFMG